MEDNPRLSINMKTNLRCKPKPEASVDDNEAKKIKGGTFEILKQSQRQQMYTILTGMSSLFGKTQLYFLPPSFSPHYRKLECNLSVGWFQ